MVASPCRIEFRPQIQSDQAESYLVGEGEEVGWKEIPRREEEGRDGLGSKETRWCTHTTEKEDRRLWGRRSKEQRQRRLSSAAASDGTGRSGNERKEHRWPQRRREQRRKEQRQRASVAVKEKEEVSVV
ncbi:hypothetical protein Syun_009781 [Stephania yunnanensis]|uniref:Uncharacterized protein n=1 Tax=Stephania yunnanensis TaxID=152371 RepID=A0AAP0KHM7_9MAGN